ncbi:rhomboid family intramembrane serine protease [Mycobacterium sp. ITM-2016-00317]|uniref:rhomboid family intramembrane serine protease n=1 Tax=Mycobacterium sp. ITM-2016-00317 TaxID=2099694 RepID=UPI00287FF204|nr:rhomboid family intramembrane serine protease [Mycobacterium sp. ITM-2016-00317]WNG87424.1 rhomboid family intramembrane serine protease [Mycobacterium sp. ITM-2016-00317]
MTYPYPSGTPAAVPTCYRHPDRQTYVRCTRCNRYICPECMHDAAVGHQCADCVSAGAQTARPVTNAVGARVARSTTPLVTYVLIAVNLVMFALQMASPNLERALGLWPPAAADGELYRLVTSAFLHFSVTHIAFNMLALYFVGPPLEYALGRLRFVALYLLSALGGSVLVYLLTFNALTAGASGAVFGLFGATFVVGRKLNMDVRSVLAIIGLNLAFTFLIPLFTSQNISWQGHVGGLVTGAVVAAAFVYAPRKQRNLVQAGAAVGLLVLFVGLVVWRTAELRTMLGLA